jgi:hypothetical protein
MGTFYMDGGPMMVPTTVFGFSLAVAAVLTLLRPARYWTLTALLAAVTWSSGLLGTTFGLIGTFRTVARLTEEPVTLARWACQGIAESLNNALLMLVFMLPSLLVCAAAAYRALKVPAPAGK